ncbi:hypothetical protein [Edaphobacter sp. 12200R-103]|uniref:hypothetical protein n=1 Tax=Edaphobacter sp. 12200R-103 TaxID=2703788 RepID=UPI00138C8647|nr:hypothetical protein [Edaphobacter sp. 12200R-103]QHS50896.1 hypothetical protein GWR55_03405 [Edaphobacter sp. 12200R-103]
MHAITRNLATTFALTTLFIVGGCKSSTPAAPANEASSQAAPAAPPPAAPAATPATAPASPAAAAAAPTPAPAPARREAAPAPAPEPVRLTVPSGTRVPVVMSQTISAKANNVGDSFSGELSSALSTSSGKVVFPRGTQVEGTVVAAKGRGRFKGEGDLAIQLSSIGGHEVTSSSYLRQEKGKGKRTAGIIGGGAGVGALIGGLAGGGKGALIGGLAGAGAGTAGAGLTGNKDIVIPAESVVTFTLQSALTVSK